jgi:hypothetical protein
MKALERLSFSGKFVLLGVLALALIVVPTILYVLGALYSGRQAERELRGVAPVQALLHVVALTQQHRGLATTVLAGDGSLQQARLAKQTEVQRSFEASEQALRAAEVDADLLSDWQQVREQWRALSEEVSQGTIKARQGMQRHTQLIASSLLIEDALLDHFELSLDPLLETYSLMNAALIEMPQTVELFGQLRGFGALYLVQGRILPEQQGALMGLTAQALASFGRLGRAFAKAAAADPAIAAMLEARRSREKNRPAHDPLRPLRHDLQRRQDDDRRRRQLVDPGVLRAAARRPRRQGGRSLDGDGRKQRPLLHQRHGGGAGADRQRFLQAC